MVKASHQPSEGLISVRVSEKLKPFWRPSYNLQISFETWKAVSLSSDPGNLVQCYIEWSRQAFARRPGLHFWKCNERNACLRKFGILRLTLTFPLDYRCEKTIESIFQNWTMVRKFISFPLFSQAGSQQQISYWDNKKRGLSIYLSHQRSLIVYYWAVSHSFVTYSLGVCSCSKASGLLMIWIRRSKESWKQKVENAVAPG